MQPGNASANPAGSPEVSFACINVALANTVSPSSSAAISAETKRAVERLRSEPHGLGHRKVDRHLNRAKMMVVAGDIARDAKPFPREQTWPLVSGGTRSSSHVAQP